MRPTMNHNQFGSRSISLLGPAGWVPRSPPTPQGDVYVSSYEKLMVSCVQLPGPQSAAT